VAIVLASGKTPAGTHRPIMVSETLDALRPRPGEIFVDGTLGYGGHALAILPKLVPGGKLIGIDADPIELQKTESRLREQAWSEDLAVIRRSNFAGLPQVLAALGIEAVDGLLVDLGVSSMQLDNPARGFSAKFDGPLDMRMNPARGYPASALLAKSSPASLQLLLESHADEPHAALLASELAGRNFSSTMALADAIRTVHVRVSKADQDASIRRVFQALRIEVNDEFSALETLLRFLPGLLRPGGRAAILTFHSGEDRRVKKAFLAGKSGGWFDDIAPEPVRPSTEERRDNPRSTSAKLRWARRSTRLPEDPVVSVPHPSLK